MSTIGIIVEQLNNAYKGTDYYVVNELGSLTFYHKQIRSPYAKYYLEDIPENSLEWIKKEMEDNISFCKAHSTFTDRIVRFNEILSGVITAIRINKVNNLMEYMDG